MKKVEKTLDISGKKITLRTGGFAEQATSAVMAQIGETVAFAAVVSADMQVDLGYFPLTVEYSERLYAGGKIKGSRWVKREGRPTDEEILKARLIDRSIRPLFSDDYKGKEVQVVVVVMSVDLENSPDIVSALAVSAALSSSSIPWAGPVGVSRVSFKDEEMVLNAVDEVQTTSSLDLIVSSTKDAVVMIEAAANEMDEKKMAEAIKFAKSQNDQVVSFISDFAKEVGRTKEKVVKETVDLGLVKKIEKFVAESLPQVVKQMATSEGARSKSYSELEASVLDNVSDSEKKQAIGILEKLKKKEIRKVILSGKRVDGRKHDEIRPLSAEVGVLPRVHGSGLFSRGQTQALTVATLASPSFTQLIETAEGEETKRYMHHYSMPPFSVGEAGRMGSPSRREIGHGALAEKALMPVIPSEDDFPYTIRVVTEILSSNGSTSMASVCGSTLSLMDAGVPIKEPVAGIAMGLIIEPKDKKVAVLTDIMGLEDGNGDMDFKIAGTKNGITALQLDVKTLDLTTDILITALDQAKKARLEILDVIVKAISGPRTEVSKNAPKIKVVKIPQDKIGELIGPGGKTIKGLMAQTDTEIDVDDDGTVAISGVNEDGVAKVVERIEAMTHVVQPGELFDGTVVRMESFGAFVEYLPGRDGLVHVSDMSEDFVNDPSEIVKMGDTVKVRVKEVDDRGRVNLSLLLDPSKDKKKFDRGSGRGGNDRNYSRGRNDGGRPRRFERRGGDRPSSGPHFPTSRLMDDKDNFRR